MIMKLTSHQLSEGMRIKHEKNQQEWSCSYQKISISGSNSVDGRSNGCPNIYACEVWGVDKHWEDTASKNIDSH